MNSNIALDWWRQQLYRHVKDFLGNPTEEHEAKLKSLMKEYQNYMKEHRGNRPSDEHEWVMDFR